MRASGARASRPPRAGTFLRLLGLGAGMGVLLCAAGAAADPPPPPAAEAPPDAAFEAPEDPAETTTKVCETNELKLRGTLYRDRHPERSIAMLSTPQSPSAAVYRPGMWVGGYLVVAIEPRGVLLEKDATYCWLRLMPDTSRPNPPPPRRVNPPPKPKKKKKKK